MENIIGGGCDRDIIRASPFALINAPMDDKSLCQLIREALRSTEKAEALALAIDHLPEVKAYLGKGWLPYYEQALLVTMRDVERNINRLPTIYPLNLEATICQNPAEAAKVRKYFIKWVMMILERDCHDVKRSHKNRPRTFSLSDRIGEGGTIEDFIPDQQNPNSLESLSNEEEIEEIKRLTESLGCYPEGYPNCTCYELIQRRLLKQPPQQWIQITIELAIPSGTLTSHWHRKCKKHLVEISQQLGKN